MNDTFDGTRLPRLFCWSRFGPEAGEPIERIVERKETERRGNGGTFFWGIGNSIAPAITELVRRVRAPQLLLSPIKNRPRDIDVTPACVVRWTAAENLLGITEQLPPTVRVTSRWDPERPRGVHYALVCNSSDPLRLGDFGRLSFGALRNMRSGAPLGASQVTAVVEQDDEAASIADAYIVALRVALVPPYFVRLRRPVHAAGDSLPQSRAADPLQLRL
jgi:hypothetical protein